MKYPREVQAIPGQLNVNALTGTIQNFSQVGIGGDVTGGSAKLYVTGNVGIGTTAPSYLTEISGGSTGTETTLLSLHSPFTGTNTATTLRFVNSSSATANTGSGEISVLRDGSANGQMRLSAGTAGGVMTNVMTLLGSGNVGIGTTGPGAKLDVAGAAKIRGTSNGAEVLNLGTAGLINAVVNTADEMYLNIDSDNNQTGSSFHFGHNAGTSGATELMRIQDNGNVGIGTTAPGAKLEIVNGSFNLQRDDNHAFITVKSAGASYLPGLDFHRATGTFSSPTAVVSGNSLGVVRGWGYDSPSTEGIGGGMSFTAAENWSASAHGFYTSFTTTSIGSTTTSERMRIDPAGNVGIGTASPTSGYKLDVSGNIRAGTTAGVSDQGVGIYYGAGGYGRIRFYDSDVNVATMHIFSTTWSSGTLANSAGAINFDSATGVTMGAWNAPYAVFDDVNGRVGIGTITPEYKLDVNGNARISGTLTLGYSGGTAIDYVCVNSSLTLISCAASDARLKINIDDISHQRDVLSDLQQLRGVYYNWDLENPANKGKESGREVGMIAQDVEKVLPELVTISTNGYRTLDYAKYTGFLTEVAKAQQSEIVSLQSRIDSQQKQINELKIFIKELKNK